MTKYSIKMENIDGEGLSECHSVIKHHRYCTSLRQKYYKRRICN